jgi:hypothetical protein
VYDGLEREGVK